MHTLSHIESHAYTLLYRITRIHSLDSACKLSYIQIRTYSPLLTYAYSLCHAFSQTKTDKQYP